MSDAGDVELLYRNLLAAWDRQSAAEYASLFADDGQIIGLDGSMVDGRGNIESHLGQIFAHHRTPRYVAKVRGVRFPGEHVAILGGVAGMVPHGQADLNPALNAVQTLVATKKHGHWRISLFQNTPAAFHGRPEESQRLRGELLSVMQAAAQRLR